MAFKLWVDDVRQMPKDYTTRLKSVNLAKFFIITYWDDIEIIDLDHDSGDYFQDGGDYIKILDWLEEYCNRTMKSIPFKFRLHSSNPAGQFKMKQIINKNRWPLVA